MIIIVTRIWVVSGDPGTGKSRMGFDCEEPIEMWDIENKNGDMQKKYYSDKLITRKNLLQFDDGFNEDWYATYIALKKEVDGLIAKGKDVKNGKRKDIGIESLVIDGISPIRNKVMLAKWNKDHPTRKQPNEFEWGDINDDVRDLLFPLVNMAIYPNPSNPDTNILPMLLVTAEFKDAYTTVEVWDDRLQKIVKKSVKSGREPAYSDYLGYKLYTLLEAHCDVKKKKYSVVCSKSLVGCWDADVTEKSIYQKVLEMGL